MIKILLNIYRKRKIVRHIKYLKEVCVIGDDFCTSSLYRNPQKQLLNVKIENLSKDPRKIVFGNKCNVSCSITLNEKGSIIVGDFTFMNYVRMRIDYNLRIGTHCLFGPNVVIWDTDNHPLSVNARHKQAEEIPGIYPLSKSYEASGGDITIENDVWIGMDSLILGGVKIGYGSIVAARSVVTRDVEPFTIVAGVPAKKIGIVPK